MSQTESEVTQTALQWAKIHIADYARLMMDNQKTLNMSADSETKLRDFQNRQREHLGKRLNQVGGEPMASSEEPMEVKIDSPTITHNHAAPAPTPPGMSPFAKAAVAGVAAAGLGAGVGVPVAAAYLMNRPQPAAVVQPADNASTQYNLKIFRPQQDASTPSQ